ncbi:conserved hypothetical protein [Solidesulfovibrio fructosivorans JJ]]|uniref:Uncharacterized protein n=1 Tax=Solidesulfovibrio fructosivorans JJ] TaxID=596151 RepID=E1JXJ1_SOLFR|nr:hypothetical protein [Solidesulfovibrio fructosivorans]EFL50968.1 conserved hypothetical protein [Solidesulfovibrio fructosivorans JJ]]
MDDFPRITIMGSEAGYSLMTQTLDHVADLRSFAVPSYASGPDGLPSKDALGAYASGIGSLADANA